MDLSLFGNTFGGLFFNFKIILLSTINYFTSAAIS